MTNIAENISQSSNAYTKNSHDNKFSDIRVHDIEICFIINTTSRNNMLLDQDWL
jgi:hypothetical protein